MILMLMYWGFMIMWPILLGLELRKQRQQRREQEEDDLRLEWEEWRERRKFERKFEFAQRPGCSFRLDGHD